MDGHLLRYNNKVKYAFCDLETFNLCLSFRQNRPWQVGILNVTGENITSSADIRVNWSDAPHLKIGKEAAAITHFSQEEHDRKALDYKDAFPKFWPMLQNCDYIVMHNGLRFDLYLLKGYAEMMGVDWKWITNKVLDTKAIAQGIKMGVVWNPKDGPFIEYQYRMSNSHVKGIKTNLGLLGKEYGIAHDYDKLHDAIVDLELNLKVWNKLKFQIEI